MVNRFFSIILNDVHINVLALCRVDVLVGHSAGSWVVYEAGANWDNVGALICVNPTGATPNR